MGPGAVRHCDGKVLVAVGISRDLGKSAPEHSPGRSMRKGTTTTKKKAPRKLKFYNFVEFARRIGRIWPSIRRKRLRRITNQFPLAAWPMEGSHLRLMFDNPRPRLRLPDRHSERKTLRPSRIMILQRENRAIAKDAPAFISLPRQVGEQEGMIANIACRRRAMPPFSERR